MQTRTVTKTPESPPLPLHVGPRLLLTATSTVTRPTPVGDLEPHSLMIRATTTSVLLSEILSRTGFRHGGLNE